jgi:aminoglycoside 3-N-acetyltransferase I
MKIQFQKLAKEELDKFIQLIVVFEDVFEMKDFKMPASEHLKELLQRDDFFVFVALNEKHEVVGGLTAYVLPQYYSVKTLAYIFDLAVKTDFQRRGIGKGLIDAINVYCKDAGMDEVFVQADKADGYALDFYRSTNPTREESVIHFSYTL